VPFCAWCSGWLHCPAAAECRQCFLIRLHPAGHSPHYRPESSLDYLSKEGRNWEFHKQKQLPINFTTFRLLCIIKRTIICMNNSSLLSAPSLVQKLH
uniref:Uncharacterized protein n=1 Tax=Mastacembelus armatus TaxID=205130 RepID=A0A3Q3NKQ2_9TELE